MKSINKQAPVSCSKSITIKASKNVVWSVLSNINRWPDWQTDITNSELNGELRPNSSFTWKSGGVIIHSTLHAVEQHQFLGWTGKSMGVYAIHNWTITENSDSLTITVDESMEGFIARIFKQALSKKLEEGLAVWLSGLKKQSELLMN